MRALVWDGQSARVIERDPPLPGGDMAVVRMSLAGICATDLQIVQGYMGFRGVLGHEFAGTVVQGPEPWPGRRVVGEINFACGRCTLCRRGLGRHCPTRQVMGIVGADGAFAELVAVPVANLHAIPDSVTDEAAVFVEPLAAAFEILEQVHVVPGIDAVVLGDGKLGLLVAQVLVHAGANLLLVGKHEDNLGVARACGIAAVALGDWNRGSADLVVEASGTAAGVELAVGATRPRGTLVLKSTVAHAAPLNLAPVVINEITVIGSRCGRFEPALRALASGQIEVERMVSARVPLAQADEGLRLAARPGTLKVLVENPIPSR